MKKYFIIILLINILFSSTMFRTGLIKSYGMGFWGPNGHDGIWHVALINQIKQNIPPLNPVYAGEKLISYHWGYDLLVAGISKLTHISVLTLHFQIMPVLLGFLIGYLSLKLAKKLTGSYLVGICFVFLNYFAGSLGWIVTLLRNGTIGGESLFWAMQSISTLINPPYALSLVLILLGLILWHKKSLFAGIIFGILVFVKVYAGVLIGLSLAILWGYQKLVNKKNNIYLLKIILIDFCISLTFLLVMGVFSGKQTLIFQPFWFIRTLFEAKDRLYLPKLGQIWWILQPDWLTSPRFWLLASFGTILFLIGNLGMRVWGFIFLVKKFFKKQLKKYDILFLTLIFLGFLFPLFFVQKGTAWNTIQFFYYSLFFANFYFAGFLAELVKNKKYLFLIIILLFTLPTTYSTLKGYWGNPPPASVPVYELEALKYLADKPKKSIILTYPFDKFKRDTVLPPKPLYLYETTAYVSAFTGKQTFLEDEMNLEITGYDWRNRRDEILKFFESKDKISARGFLLNNNINYIYLVNNQSIKLLAQNLGIEQIFDKNNIKIYKVLK